MPSKVGRYTLVHKLSDLDTDCVGWQNYNKNVNISTWIGIGQKSDRCCSIPEPMACLPDIGVLNCKGIQYWLSLLWFDLNYDGHNMETLSELRVLWVGNPPLTGGALMGVFVVILTKVLDKQPSETMTLMWRPVMCLYLPRNIHVYVPRQAVNLTILFSWATMSTRLIIQDQTLTRTFITYTTCRLTIANYVFATLRLSLKGNMRAHIIHKGPPPNDSLLSY